MSKLLPWRGVLHDVLLDRAEDASPGLVQHLQAHLVATLEARRPRLAVQDGLDGAHLGEAGIAGTALAHGLARPAIALVGDGAGANDGAGAETPSLGRMGDQLWK